MEEPFISVKDLDRDPEHGDLIITLRIADPDSQVSEILGIPVATQIA